MKKSEFERRSLEYWMHRSQPGDSNLVGRDVRAAEAAGVIWDPEKPEEDPLPERVYVPDAGRFPTAFLMPEWRLGWAGEEHKRAGHLEAARRWNAWQEVWKVQRAMEDHEDWALIRGFADQLRAILGGAQPATCGTYHNSREQRLEDAVGALWLELQVRVHGARKGRTMSSLEDQVRAALDRDWEPS